MEQNVKRLLPVVLTAQEVIDRAMQMSEEVTKRDELEVIMKDVARQYKNTIMGHDKKVRDLARIVTDGSEPRMVECSWHFDYKKMEKALIREDTGEVVTTAALTDTERQLMLDQDLERTQSSRDEAPVEQPTE
jgi:hypothetical protein